MQRRPNQFRIKQLISGSFIAIFFAFALLIFLVLQFIARPILLKENDKIIQQFGEKIVLHVKDKIHTTETIATSMASLGEILDFNEEVFRLALPALMNSKDDFTDIVAGGGIWPEPFAFDPLKERNSLFWGRQKDGTLKYFNDYNEMDSRGYHNEAWYVPGKFVKKGSCFWSKAYIDPYSLQPMVTCTAPMWRNRKFIGVATVDLKLDGLARFFQAQKLYNEGEGYTFALDRDNMLLSLPMGENSEELLPHEDQVGDLKSLDDLVNEHHELKKLSLQLNKINHELTRVVGSFKGMLNEIAAQIASESYQITQDEATLIASILITNQGHATTVGTRSTSRTSIWARSFEMDDPLAFNKPAKVCIFLIPNTFWRIVTSVPRSQSSLIVNNISKILFISLIVFMAIPLLALFGFLNRLFLKPLASLTAQLRHLKGATYSDVLKLNYNGKNELGELVSGLNQRADKLREVILELENSEANYRAIFNSVNEAIFIHDLEKGSIIDVNDSMLEMYKMTKEETLQSNAGALSSGVFPYTQEEAMKRLDRAKGGEDQIFEWQARDNEGQNFWIEVSLKRSEFSKVNRILSVVRNISARKKTDLRFKRLRYYLNNIINSMPSIIAGVNLKGEVSIWNKRAEEASGINQSNALNVPVEQLLPFLKPEHDNINYALNNGIPFLGHRLIHLKDDQERHFDLAVFPLSSTTDKGAVIRIDDVTEIVKKDQQLVQAQKMETVGVLAGGLAHDFNNILGGMTGSLSMLDLTLNKTPYEKEQAIRKYMGFIGASTERAKNMVTRLLTLSRKQEFTEKPVDLNKAIRNVLNICKDSFDKSVRLDPQYYKSQAVSLVDPTQIEQALLNIFVNAEHAMTHMRPKNQKWGGKLIIRIRKHIIEADFKHRHPEAKHDKYWQIIISDTGIGMPLEILTHIFNPFFTTKEHKKGSGLGLSMVYNIISQHSGFIDARSKEDVGTSFDIFLPIIDKEANEIDSSEIKLVIKKMKGTVLIVDDEDIIRTIGKEMLENFGLEVIIAHNGKDALKKLQKHLMTIDLIILDMVMPIMSGKEAFREIKKIAPHIDVIMSSGFKADLRVQAILDKGAAGFIQKPYTIKDLYKVCSAIFHNN